MLISTVKLGSKFLKASLKLNSTVCARLTLSGRNRYRVNSLARVRPLVKLNKNELPYSVGLISSTSVVAHNQSAHSAD